MCFSCNTSICTQCNSFSHIGISCEAAQPRHNEIENRNYISKYCKKCPHCNCIVQKIKTPEQEEYEQRTGMQGGTQECHHMTCDSCKQDFCWICMEGYGQTRYYHVECPTSDIFIRFTGTFPSMIGLPPGQYRYIDILINDGETRLVKQYNILNRNPLLGAPRDKNNTNTVTIISTPDGIIEKISGKGHELTYRQENKIIF